MGCHSLVPRSLTGTHTPTAPPFCKITAVYIAAPPGSHLELALKCAAKGLPTYVEKPAARNATETRQMIAAFVAAKVPLFVAYYRRGQSRFLKARAVMDSGVLGTVTSLTYSMVKPPVVVPKDGALPWRLQASHAGGGLLLDVGCHTIDIIDFIVGPLADVVGGATRVLSDAAYDVEDTVALTGTFAGNAVATMSWSFAGPPSGGQDEIVIRGTKGELRLSTFGSEPVRVTLYDASGSATVTEHAFPRPAHVHQPLVQTIVNELRGVNGGVDACPSRGDNALRVAIVIDTVLTGFYGGRDDPFWLRQGMWPGQF